MYVHVLVYVCVKVIKGISTCFSLCLENDKPGVGLAALKCVLLWYTLLQVDKGPAVRLVLKIKAVFSGLGHTEQDGLQESDG